jgi:hypothetical protein
MVRTKQHNHSSHDLLGLHEENSKTCTPSVPKCKLLWEKIVLKYKSFYNINV